MRINKTVSDISGKEIKGQPYAPCKCAFKLMTYNEAGTPEVEHYFDATEEEIKELVKALNDKIKEMKARSV